MADTLDKAIDKLRDLSPKRRRAAAALIEEFLEGEAEPVYVLSDEERALVDEGLAELDRGEYATHEQVKADIAKILKS